MFYKKFKRENYEYKSYKWDCDVWWNYCLIVVFHLIALNQYTFVVRNAVIYMFKTVLIHKTANKNENKRSPNGMSGMKWKIQRYAWNISNWCCMNRTHTYQLFLAFHCYLCTAHVFSPLFSRYKLLHTFVNGCL